MWEDPVAIDLKDLSGSYPVVLGQIVRMVRQHSGWQSVHYNGKRYQLFGGIRNNYFINVSNPIKPKPQPADYVSFSSLRRSADYVPC